MNRITQVAVILCLVCTASTAVGAYQLVWADEFDGTQINTANWEPQVFGGAGSGNNELQYYTDLATNAFVADGYLHIVAREEPYEGYNYTSARLHSAGRQDFLYGRMEARIKVPAGKGYWPAFWMMPTQWVYGGWAASGELDIMETVNAADFITGSIHFGGEYPNNDHTNGTYTDGQTIFADAFHVYTVEWEPTQMRWYVDGNLYSTKNNTQWWCDTAAWNDLAPFDQDFHFILNIAVGGDWPGAPDGSTVFPQEMLVDYVRVYQHANIAPTVAITSPSNGANLPAGNVTIEANASDTDGTISRVRFFANGTFLDEDTTAPYSTVWSATDGCYTLKAWAMDDIGGVSEDVIDVTVGVGCPQLPYYGSPQSLPGKIEAEDFDLGVNGAAYYDLDAGNNGGQYRTDVDVDIEACAEGGYNVGWISDGEWMDYQVDVTSSATYTVDVRVASFATGGAFHIEFDGVDKTGTINVPVTGDWQGWTTVTATADLSSGLQEMTFVKEGSTADEFNLNYFNISDGSIVCGNGICDPGEDCTTCSSDCIGVTGGKPSNRYCCGDGVCEGAENTGNCAVDCSGGGSYCGDGTCDPGEDSGNCPEDCGSSSYCGDGTCDPGEDQCNCSNDCGTPPSTETNCTDGIDNDCGGGTDCADSDCSGDPACDCLPKSSSCSSDSECCSNKCRGGACR